MTKLAAFREGSRRGSAHRIDSAGFTLIEVIITIALVALLGGTIISGSGMMGSNRLRSAAGLVITASRLAVTRANATGNPVRIVFDIDAQRIVLEETTDRMLRVKDTGGGLSASGKNSEGAAAGADPATEAERESIQYSEGILKGPKAPRARFKGIPIGAGADAEKGRDLGSGIVYRLVQTEHDNKPREKGRAYLYFWPGGGTERAVIQLEQKNGDQVLSVLVHPLTGRAQIKRGKFDYEEPRTEEEFGQREAETP